MGFYSTFTGSQGKKQAAATLAYNQGQAREGYVASRGYQERGYTAATGRYAPYAETGVRAHKAYGDILGLNGADAQGAASAAYDRYDPYEVATQQRLMRSGDRRAAATGQYSGGLNALARARVADESESRNYDNYLARLERAAGQGVAVAGQQAGLDMGHAGAMTGIESGYRNANMGAQSQYGRDYTAADTAGVQNWIGLGTTLATLGRDLARGGVVGNGVNWLGRGRGTGAGIDHGYRP